MEVLPLSFILYGAFSVDQKEIVDELVEKAFKLCEERKISGESKFAQNLINRLYDCIMSWDPDED